MIRGVSPEIERILEAGNSAPSGENCQPWCFVVRGLQIEVHLLPERDQSAYSWGQRTSYLANGAVLENMVVAASAEQYRADVQYFPNPQDQFHVATLVLVFDHALQPDPLVPSIAKRISNRKRYATTPLTDIERESLARAAQEAGAAQFILAEKREQIQALARVGSTNEEVMLANKTLHQFFFNHVSWTKEEDDAKKVGFYIKTLELPPPAETMFKVFRRWSNMRLFNLVGFNHIVAMQNAATNASAAAIGALAIRQDTPLEFIKIGRAVERVWLTATALGISFQPLTGLFFFNLGLRHEGGGVFTADQTARITRACDQAEQMLNVTEGHIAFMFRLGHSEAPSAHAVRFPLEEVVTVIS